MPAKQKEMFANNWLAYKFGIHASAAQEISHRNHLNYQANKKKDLNTNEIKLLRNTKNKYASVQNLMVSITLQVILHTSGTLYRAAPQCW